MSVDYPPSPIPPGYVPIPWQLCLDADPLHGGRLEGRVPDGWSRDGWATSLLDRMTRTDDSEALTRLRGELDGIMGAEAGTIGTGG